MDDIPLSATISVLLVATNNALLMETMNQPQPYKVFYLQLVNGFLMTSALAKYDHHKLPKSFPLMVPLQNRFITNVFKVITATRLIYILFKGGKHWLIEYHIEMISIKMKININKK